MIEVKPAAVTQVEWIGAPGAVGAVAVAHQLQAGGAVFCNEPFVVVEVVGLYAAEFFPQPAAEGVVAVAGDGVAAGVFDAIRESCIIDTAVSARPQGLYQRPFFPNKIGKAQTYC